MITRKKESLALRIPAGEGKGPNQVIDDAEAPPHPGMGKYVVIRGRERKPKLGHQLLVIVEPQVGHEG
jgi:hypothetical protein